MSRDRIVAAARQWAADQITAEMQHWPAGMESFDAIKAVRERILNPHPYIRHQLDTMVAAAAQEEGA